MSSVRLTPTSYVVLGLVEQCGPATPYEIKQVAEISTVHFWTVPHTQLYTECARLADGGLLHEEREDTGRRRRVYALTDPGRQALDAWRSDDTTELAELRDVGLVKLFFGADPARLAPGQVERHEARLAAYEAVADAPMPDGMRLALEAGIGHEREYLRFWRSIMRDH